MRADLFGSRPFAPPRGRGSGGGRRKAASVAGLLFAVVLALVPASASAHLGLDFPPSRYGAGVLKDGPCGMVGGTRSDNVTTFEPGETIELVFREYIDHPGHYRVAFDPDGDDDLADPACLSGCDTRTPEIELNTAGVMILADGIEDRVAVAGDSTYRLTVTLPDVECDNCTLQVIQVMYDKPPQTRPGNDLYYQCAALILRRTGGTDGGTPPPSDGGVSPRTDAGTAVPGDGGCSCRASASSSASPLAWLALPLLVLLRRRSLRTR